MSSSIDQSLLDRYLAGECTAREAADVEQWLEADAANRRALEAFRRAATPPGTEVRADVDAGWARMRQRIRQSDAADATPHPRLAERRRSVQRSAWTTGLRAAAAVVLLLAAVWTWQQLGGGAPGAAVLELVETAPGERRTLQLADGSEVVLGVDSRIRFSRDLTGAAREVFLDGEAYFRVVHEAGRPFRVHARHAVVQVLGTEFAVQAYGEQAEVQVVVAEGSVRLALADTAAADTGVVLSGGDLGRAAPTAVTATRGVDPARHLDWMHGRLVLHDTPLHEAMRRFERWYGIEFRVAEPELADRRVTLMLRGESLDELLETLGLVLDVVPVREQDRVMLYPTGAGREVPGSPDD
jgi:transmembrane sensor